MQCPRCDAGNRDGARFCRECGGALDVVCAACGGQVEPSSRFCDTCGSPLPVPVSPAAAQFGSPRKYTPRYLADKILTSLSAIEGERKQVTVLFVDVAGFTSLSEGLDPEDVHTLITRALELMLAEVHRLEGTVNQFLGDGIMALFGAPIAHEDHARRAVMAALGIRRALEEYESELRGRGITFQVRQALNTGLVVVGRIGSDLRMDYTAVGDTTNVAARLEQAADPGRILISDTTNRLAEGYFHTRSLGPIALKGKAELVPAWEVISARVSRTRMDVERERGLTPFVGRKHELQHLQAAFEKARAGHGQVVFLVGEAGIGKSRLLLEFRRRLGDSATWLEGHAFSFGQAIAFHSFVDLLKRQFRIEDADSQEAMAAKIERSVLPLGEDLRPILPYLRSLLSLDPGDSAVAAMDPKQRRARIQDASRRLLLRAAEIRPQVVLYEDVHWMDTASEEVMLAIEDVIPSNRILEILTYRTGYVGRQADRTYHSRITLDVLAPEACVHMARAMLGVERLPEDLEAFLARKGEGNPFFVEELVKSLRETGTIRQTDGGYVLTKPLGRVVVPGTVQDIVMARIDRLADGPKRALQVASVIGREFTGILLKRMTAEVPVPIETALAELLASEFVYEKRLVPEIAYTFHHAVTQEVAYNSLLVQRRKELHRLIGAAIEELYADRVADQYEVLAHHFLRGEEYDRAREYLLKAGEKAARAFANREAFGFYEQALELLPEDERAARADLMKKLATIAQYLGDADASLRYAQLAVELYEALGDKRNAVAMHLHVDVLYSWQWDGAREDWGLKHMEAAAALVDHDPDSVEKGLVYQRTAHRYLHRSQPRTTLTWAQRAADLFARLGASMGTSLGTALICTGRIDEGVAYSEKNWEPVRKAGVPVVMAVFGHELSLTLALARDVPRARRWGELVLPEVVKASPVFEAMLRRPLTLIYALSGEVAKAAEACRAVETIEEKSLLGCIYEDACGVGLHYLRIGEWGRAREYLERLLPLYEERSNVAAVAACSLVLGNVLLESGDHAGAGRRLARSVEIARQGGNVLLEAWAAPLLCDLALAMGTVESAAEHVQRGLDLLEPGRNWYGLVGSLERARGRVAAAQGRWNDAIASFETAIAVNRRYELPWDEAHTLDAVATAYLERGAAGDDDRARASLEHAERLFRRIGAGKDLAKVVARKGVAAD